MTLAQIIFTALPFVLALLAATALLILALTGGSR